MDLFVSDVLGSKAVMARRLSNVGSLGENDSKYCVVLKGSQMNVENSLGGTDGGCFNIIGAASKVVDVWTPKMSVVHPSIESPIVGKDMDVVNVSHPAHRTVDANPVTLRPL